MRVRCLAQEQNAMSTARAQTKTGQSKDERSNHEATAPPTASIALYYMASSASGQDESNSALRLATRAGKMELSCPLGTTRRVPQEKNPKSHIINPLLTKFAQSRWLDIGLVLLLRVY